jgi:pSer/pThr/pTyr-binding forkhead associated (FHA) protein
MRLTVKQNESTINEFEFQQGPIYIGRHANSQIYLGHRAVSRQHAVIFQDKNGKWIAEDLDSTNKTYLNDQTIHKSEIKTGDVIKIVDFSIEVNIGPKEKKSKAIDLEDTLTKTVFNLEETLTAPHDIVVRKPDAGGAPAMRLPAQRLKDFSRATESISKVHNSDELLLKLLDIVLDQFGANRVWCALRNQPTGPMTSHSGRQRSGRAVDLAEIKLAEKITQVVEKTQYMMLPRVSAQMEAQEQISSAMIAPIMRQTDCFGVIYIDNAGAQKNYTLSDLDYLMLITIHTATVLEKL